MIAHAGSPPARRWAHVPGVHYPDPLATTAPPSAHRKRPLLLAERLQILDLDAQGVPRAEIARRLGRARPVVGSVLLAAGRRVNAPSKRITPGERAQIIALDAVGLSRREIADRLQRKPWVVSYVLIAAGRRKLPYRRRPQPAVAELERAYSTRDPEL